MNNILTLNPSLSVGGLFAIKNKLTLKVFYIFSIASVAALLFFYIFQINEIIRGSYIVKNYEVKIEKIAEENGILENKLLESGSLAKIEVLAKNLNFEKIEGIKYIQVLGPSVVKK